MMKFKTGDRVFDKREHNFGTVSFVSESKKTYAVELEDGRLVEEPEQYLMSRNEGCLISFYYNDLVKDTSLDVVGYIRDQVDGTMIVESLDGDYYECDINDLEHVSLKSKNPCYKLRKGSKVKIYGDPSDTGTITVFYGDGFLKVRCDLDGIELLIKAEHVTPTEPFNIEFDGYPED